MGDGDGKAHRETAEISASGKTGAIKIGNTNLNDIDAKW
jgi:hypothetical protein